MSRINKIQVFEQSSLSVGHEGFTRKHFELLSEYKDKNQINFFDLGHNKIRFNQYVGVIQVGNLVIEILPKIDADTDKAKWHKVLLEMLHIAGYIHLEKGERASLNIRQFSLIDLFFREFIIETQHLVQSGLIKKYLLTEMNLSKVKGKILFPQHLRHNFINKERTFCAFSEYNTNNIYNRILKKALTILGSITHNSEMIKQSKSILDSLCEIDLVNVTEDTFNQLDYNRKTERYRNAMVLAKLIILNYSPDFEAGSNSVISFLFDMNMLFEKYVYRCLKKHAHMYPYLDIKAQVSHRIWESTLCKRSIRPDIVIKDNRDNRDNSVFVLDTKWKKPKQLKPSDEDLKQMYVYNMYYSSKKSFLMYPSSKNENLHNGNFIQASSIPEIKHACSLWFMDIVSDYGLNKELGQQILARINECSTY